MREKKLPKRLRGRNYYQSISKNLRNKRKINPEFESRLASLNLEEIIALKLELTAKAVGGKTRFKLSNAQLWESQSVLSSIKLNNFRAKNKIVIEEATMGGFWMINTSSNVKIKVKRIS